MNNKLIAQEWFRYVRQDLKHCLLDKYGGALTLSPMSL